MAGSVNKVILVGNLGRDPEIRSTQDGTRVANLSLATSESWRDKTTGERREKTEWHSVVIFSEGLCRIAEQYLKKGSKVYIEGALQTRKWADQDRPRVDRPAVFDADHITRKLGRIEREEKFWESLFTRHGITPQRVEYEDFVGAQEDTVRAVLESLGVEAPAALDLPAPRLGRQADELSDEWAERYRRSLTSPGPAPGAA